MLIPSPGAESYLDHTAGMMRIIPLLRYTVADIEKDITDAGAIQDDGTR
jgi:hypothetical protein